LALISRQARAWVESEVRSQTATVDVDRAGKAIVTQDLTISVRGGPLPGFELSGVDLDAEPLPGASDVIAFLYGPIVLAGRMGQQGLAPGNQIIVNERESGSMLKAEVEIPVLAGEVPGLLKRIRRDPHAPLTFRTVGARRPRDAELAPYYRLAHERYNLYWKVAPG